MPKAEMSLKESFAELMSALDRFRGRSEPVNRAPLSADAEAARYAQRLQESDEATYELIRDRTWVG